MRAAPGVQRTSQAFPEWHRNGDDHRWRRVRVHFPLVCGHDGEGRDGWANYADTPSTASIASRGTICILILPSVIPVASGLLTAPSTVARSMAGIVFGLSGIVPHLAAAAPSWGMITWLVSAALSTSARERPSIFARGVRRPAWFQSGLSWRRADGANSDGSAADPTQTTAPPKRF